MKHLSIKSYQPVFERVVKKGYWLSGQIGHKLYEKGEYFPYFRIGNCHYRPCNGISSHLKTMHRIMQIRRHRIGQLELFRKITPKKRLKREDYVKVYC